MLLPHPDDYMHQLIVTSGGDAVRMWREEIKKAWEHQCAYCGSSDNLTMDHVRPRSMGGQDKTNNVVCCCHKCNKSKAATNWEDWYSRQDFFTLDRYHAIRELTQPTFIGPMKRLVRGKNGNPTRYVITQPA